MSGSRLQLCPKAARPRRDPTWPRAFAQRVGSLHVFEIARGKAIDARYVMAGFSPEWSVWIEYPLAAGRACR